MYPIRPHDKARLGAAIGQMSDRSRYLRFFSGVKTLPDSVLDRLADVDGDRHIAWGASDLGQPDYKAVGAVHAVRIGGTRQADLAMAVADDYHGQGIARLLIAAVVSDCLNCGIDTLSADTLTENTVAKTLLRSLGGLSASSAGPVTTYRMSAHTMQRKLWADRSCPAMLGLQAALTFYSGTRRAS